MPLVYVVGGTYGKFIGETNASGTGYGHDVYVTKYNAAGTRLWLDQFGTSQADYAYGVAVDAAGNAFVTGQTNGVALNDVDAQAHDGDLGVARDLGREIEVEARMDPSTPLAPPPGALGGRSRTASKAHPSKT